MSCSRADVVARAIQDEMRDEGVEHEWLSFEQVDREAARTHFANIRAHCLEEGRDILCEPIPVVPTQHYFMGGVWVDRDSATTMPHLYAAGETAMQWRSRAQSAGQQLAARVAGVCASRRMEDGHRHELGGRGCGRAHARRRPSVAAGPGGPAAQHRRRVGCVKGSGSRLRMEGAVHESDHYESGCRRHHSLCPCART